VQIILKVTDKIIFGAVLDDILILRGILCRLYNFLKVKSNAQRQGSPLDSAFVTTFCGKI
jgi:hypothetical protein